MSSCRKGPEAYTHASEHPHGHDHHADNHGHGAEEMQVVMTYSDQYELFAEHPVVTKGKATDVLLHITVLASYRPLVDGRVVMACAYEGKKDKQRKLTVKSHQAGIYSAQFVAQEAGDYDCTVIINNQALPEFCIDVVAAGHGHGDAHGHDHQHDTQAHGIELLKEQQWTLPFRVDPVAKGALASTIEAAGVVDLPPTHQAEVTTPIAGRFVFSRPNFPRPGAVVRQGQVLAHIVPAPSSAQEVVQAKTQLAAAQARATASVTALARAKRLYADQAISARDVELAQQEATIAAENLRAARAGITVAGRHTVGTGGDNLSAMVPLVAPIAGTIDSVGVMGGALVTPGDRILYIVKSQQHWIRARLSGQDAARVVTEKPALFKGQAMASWQPMQFLSMSKVVDVQSQTVEAIYAVSQNQNVDVGDLRIGSAVAVQLPTSDAVSGVIVPLSAVIQDEAYYVVYVQQDGEHFEERRITLGAQQGNAVSVVSGLDAGMRIVTQGANYVRLAARKNDSAGHGHIH